MPDVFIATNRWGAEQLAYAVANLHQLPVIGAHFGGGIHVDMPEDYTPGQPHPGWSVRPYPNVRRLSPSADQWGVLVSTTTQAIWNDLVLRAERLNEGQIATITELLPTAQALNATWNNGAPAQENEQVGEANIVKFGADPNGIANSTVAINAAGQACGAKGVLTCPPGDYKVNADALQLGERIISEQYPGSVRFFAATPGEWLLFVSGSGSVVSGTWDGLDMVDDCILVAGISASLYCEAKNAIRHGINYRLGKGNIAATVSDCGSHGLMLWNANGSRVQVIEAKNNGGYGFAVEGKFILNPDPLATAGDVTVQFAVCEGNVAGASYWNGVEGGVIHRMRAEGGGDGIRVERSHNLTVNHATVSGGNTPNRFARVIDSQSITFRSCSSASAINGETNPYFAIRKEGVCTGIRNPDCWYHTSVGSIPMPFDPP